jgi:hypothetical protein
LSGVIAVVGRVSFVGTPSAKSSRMAFAIRPEFKAGPSFFDRKSGPPAN